MKPNEDQEGFLDYVRQRVERDPKNDVLRMGLASYLERLSRPADAIAHLEQISSPDHLLPARHAKGRCLAQLGRIDEARAVLREALDESEPGSDTAHKIVDDLCSLPGGPGGTWKS